MPKGRRFGGTQGGAHAFIEWAIEGDRCLWGDTVYANISRYIERYLKPAFDSSPDPIRYEWKDRHQVMTIGDRGGYIDFRSADKPENWEGFGYHRIFLNEAGIIMRNRDLYTKSVLPMLMDFDSSRLYAVGTPKGKLLRDGTEHPFFTVAERSGKDNHRTLRFSSYDNPKLSRESVQELESEIAAANPGLERQEIWGEFIDAIAGNLFAFAFDIMEHRRPVVHYPDREHFFSIDFNVDPFTAIVSHIWEDHEGPHYHTFDELSSKEASIEGMARWIRGICERPHLIRITGDRGGMSRAIGKGGPIKLFVELCRALGISQSQLEVPPNPTHLQSREDFNYVLTNHPDRKIDPKCRRLLADLQTVEVDHEGKIKKADRAKRAQQADALDCDRYTVNTYLRRYLQHSRR